MTKKLDEKERFLTSPDLVQYLCSLTLSNMYRKHNENPAVFVILLWFQIVLARYFYESHKNQWVFIPFIEIHLKCIGFTTNSVLETKKPL